MFPKLVAWAKANPVLAVVLALAVAWTANHVLSYRRVDAGFVAPADVENFSTCLQKKQIYLNSCDPDQPSNVADVNIENRFGKMYINILLSAPFAIGGDFSSHSGAYHAFLINPKNKESVNIGTFVRSGDGYYRLSNELLGDYSQFSRIDVFRQILDYEPKRIVTGSITSQNCSSL